MRTDILGPAKDPAKLQCYSEPDRGRKTQDSQKFPRGHTHASAWWHARYLANNIVSCLEQLLKSASQKNTKPVLVILPLVQDILPYLLDSHAVKDGNSSTKSLKQSPAGRLIFALLRTQAFLSDSRFSELTFRSFQNSVVSKTVRQQSGNSGGNADEEATTKWSPALLSLFPEYADGP